MRWIIFVTALFACGSSMAQDRNYTGSRQDKIKKMCAAEDWETVEEYALAEIASLDSRIIAANNVYTSDYTSLKDEKVQVLTQLARSHNARGQWKDAQHAANQAATLAADGRVFRGPPSEWLKDEREAYALQQQGLAFFGDKKYPDAEKTFRYALTLASGPSRYDRLLNADHYDTAAILVNLADALLAQDKKAEAKPHLQRAAVIFEEKLGPDDERIKDARAKLDGLKEHKRPIAVMAE